MAHMNLKDTLSFHLSWLSGLRTSVFNGMPIDVDAAGNDKACVLGQWIYENVDRYAGDEAFEQLKEVHAEFHLCAQEAASLAQNGQRDAALKRLEPQGSCHQKSDQVILLASALFRNMDESGPKTGAKTSPPEPGKLSKLLSALFR
jgi:hypothetical protein